MGADIYVYRMRYEALLKYLQNFHTPEASRLRKEIIQAHKPLADLPDDSIWTKLEQQFPEILHLERKRKI